METTDVSGTGRGEAAGRPLVLSRDHVWPVGIAVALLIVVLVNIAFIVVAVNGSDDVDPAYVEGQR